MPTMTLPLSDEFLTRVIAAARHSGLSEQDYVIEAIAEKTELVERRINFDSLAEERYSAIHSTCRTISWQEMRGYLADRLDGNRVTQPVARIRARLS
jgi:hypothetical protein